MTKIERKLLLINGVLGTALTLLVLVLDYFGQLQALERWFYDSRAKYCQFFMKPPSDKLIYLDIDDGALDTIGRWPWSRDKWAQILDELSAAGPQLVFLDIVFSEPEKPYGVPMEDGSFVRVDQDPTLAAAVHRAGNILVPITLKYSTETPSPVETAIYKLLYDDVELTPSEISTRLKSQNVGHRVSEAEFDNLFISARRTAMADRLRTELAKSDRPILQLRARILPRTDPRLVDSPLIRLLNEEYEKYQKLLPLQRFMLHARPGLPELASTGDEIAPLAILGRGAGGSGFVNCIEDDDGAIRRIPLMMRHRGQIVPQIGLVIAAKLLGADLNTARVDSTHIGLACSDGRTIVIPMMTRAQSDTGQPIGALMDIPYFGGTEWQTMYDLHGQHSTRHIPMNMVWQVFQTCDAISINNQTADRAVANLNDLFPDDVAAYSAQKFDIRNPAARLVSLGKFLESIDALLKGYDGVKDLNDDDRKMIANLNTDKSGLTALIVSLRQLDGQLKSQRQTLHSVFAGKAVLVGSTASGDAYDLKPTPLHEKCPGMVIHGVIANGILTGELWREAPLWVRHVLTLIMGLATTTFVLRLHTSRAVLATTALALSYLLINGIVLFDYFNIILGVAGPIVAILVTWLSCQLVEILVEKAERRRITKRFRSYVDPALVRYVIEHPEQDVMSGHEREMTVVFTDLAGFTTISEALKEKVVPLLNEYLGMMVGIIRRHNGYVNKFLGDGIMFFYNAPWDNPNHAADAIATVMDMQEAMVTFNSSLKERGLPALTMRAGIVTGKMIAGDAGSTDGSDYTVIGDNVNLAARLESANKATDTKVMMTARTSELLNGQYLIRPTARLQVKGKTEGVDTCELIARSDQASDRQRRYAELGKAVFDAFVKADFAACLKAVETAEAELGKTKLTAASRELSEQYLREPPDASFKGEIVLHEK